MQVFRYGTYGFMSLLLSTQLAYLPKATAKNLDRAALDAKKSARTAKRSVHKAGRNLTGHGSTLKDAKEEIGDGTKNLKDEAHYAKKHINKSE